MMILVFLSLLDTYWAYCLAIWNLIDLCVLFVKICELIRSQFKSNLFRNSLSFMGGVISGLNKQICLYQKLKWEKENAIISFSYGYNKSPLKGVKTPKQSIKRQQPFWTLRSLNCYLYITLLLYHTTSCPASNKASLIKSCVAGASNSTTTLFFPRSHQ